MNSRDHVYVQSMKKRILPKRFKFLLTTTFSPNCEFMSYGHREGDICFGTFLFGMFSFTHATTSITTLELTTSAFTSQSNETVSYEHSGSSTTHYSGEGIDVGTTESKMADPFCFCVESKNNKKSNWNDKVKDAFDKSFFSNYKTTAPSYEVRHCIEELKENLMICLEFISAMQLDEGSTPLLQNCSAITHTNNAAVEKAIHSALSQLSTQDINLDKVACPVITSAVGSLFFDYINVWVILLSCLGLAFVCSIIALCLVQRCQKNGGSLNLNKHEVLYDKTNAIALRPLGVDNLTMEYSMESEVNTLPPPPGTFMAEVQEKQQKEGDVEAYNNGIEPYIITK